MNRNLHAYVVSKLERAKILRVENVLEAARGLSDSGISSSSSSGSSSSGYGSASAGARARASSTSSRVGA